MKKHFVVLFLVFVLLVLKADAADTTKLRLLFVGNSLTYTNDLPTMVKEIAKQDGVSVETVSHCFANYSLEDHWNDGTIQQVIKTGKFNYIIVQQGPSAMPASKDLLINYTGKFAAACKESGLQLVVFTVWPATTRIGDSDNVIASYKAAANATGAILAPAGLIWKEVNKKDSSIALYGTDGFHPSPKGSWLSALTIYASIQRKTNFAFITKDNSPAKKYVSNEEASIFHQVLESVLNSAF